MCYSLVEVQKMINNNKKNREFEAGVKNPSGLLLPQPAPASDINQRGFMIGVSFEVYLKSESGERGYEIDTGWVNSKSLVDAKERIINNYGDLFDCFIDLDFACMNSDDVFTTI